MTTVDRDLRALDEKALNAAIEAVHPTSPPHIAIPAAIRAYLTAAESALSASGAPGPVAVKPLTWELVDDDWWGAETVVGVYEVRQARASVRVRFCEGGMIPFDGTIEAAKAAAQADYETRIRSALAHPQASSLGWRTDMENAPRDRLLILAKEFIMPGDWRIKIGGWREDWGKWEVFGASWQPTLWLPLDALPPLPAAPLPAQQEADER